MNEGAEKVQIWKNETNQCYGRGFCFSFFPRLLNYHVRASANPSFFNFKFRLIKKICKVLFSVLFVLFPKFYLRTITTIPTEVKIAVIKKKTIGNNHISQKDLTVTNPDRFSGS
jgi:hypothetical protein